MGVSEAMSAMVASPVWSGVVGDLTSMVIPPVEKVVRTVLVYLGIALILRVAGKRLMAQMNNLDLVVVLLLSNVVQNAIIGDDNSLSGGLLGAVVLVGVNAVVDRWSRHDPRLRWLLSGRATTLIDEGRVDEHALARLGITRLELRETLRHQGADSVEEVQTAKIAPGGSVTVDLRPEEQSVSRAELWAAVDELAALIREERPRPER